MRNAKNIIRHELIGLDCNVIDALNKMDINVSGRIIDETMKTLLLETRKGRKRIQKKGSVFRTIVGKKRIEIDGNYIISRPEDRIKKKFKKW